MSCTRLVVFCLSALAGLVVGLNTASADKPSDLYLCKGAPLVADGADHVTVECLEGTPGDGIALKIERHSTADGAWSFVFLVTSTRAQILALSPPTHAFEPWADACTKGRKLSYGFCLRTQRDSKRKPSEYDLSRAPMTAWQCRGADGALCPCPSE